jgi:glycosyltransferase involved in cell wall biosynthesis
MKLLEITRSYYPSVGGLEKSVLERTKIYERLGIQYSILSTSFTTEKRDESISVKNVKYLYQLTPYNIVPALPFYLKEEYDIVSINLLGRFFSDYAIYHYRNRRQKIVLTPHFTFHTDRLLLFKKCAEKYMFPKLLNIIDALVVFSEYEKSYWIEQYRVDERKIFVIPHHVSRCSEDQVSNIQFPHERYFLYVGRTGNNKKTNLLLKAFLCLKIVDLSLILTIRSEDVAEELRAEVLRDKRIQLHGFVDEIEKNKLMAGAEAIIFPTSWEAFGYVAFEASMWKKPLLCSDIPVLRESLDSRGVLFFRNETEHLVHVMVEFMSYSREKKIRMGQTNYHHLKKYSFEETCNHYKNMFASMIKT